MDRNLRKCIIWRFNVWSEDFRVLVDGQPVGISDRDYFDKLEYVLVYGEFENTHFRGLSKKKTN